MKKITVIIPVYNMEKWLPECLDSVLKQTLQEIDIICIDDGSTDSSLKILKEYSSNDQRIKVISQENQGVSTARNLGMKQADSEYVCFMDPDDFYPDENVLSDLYVAAKSHHAKICGGSFSDYNQVNGEITTNFTGSYIPYMFTRDGYIDYRDYQYDYGYHRFIYDLEMLRENQLSFPNYKRFQDPPFFVKAMLQARKFYALKRITYCYRYGHQTINWSVEKIVDFCKGICENLKISSEEQFAELHAYTVQRVIDQKMIFADMNKLVYNLQIQQSICNIAFLIRVDLLQKSKYHIELEGVAQIFYNVFDEFKERNKQWELMHQQIEDYKRRIVTEEKRYEELKNSETFKIGKYIVWFPRKLLNFIKR